MKNRLCKTVFSFLLGSVLFISASAQPAFAASCQFTVTGAQGGTLNIRHGESISISIQNAELEDTLINAPDNSAFYINVPETWRRYYIPASRVSNGNIQLNLTNDSSGNYLFNPDTTHTLQLVHDRGPISNHTVVCSSSAQVVTGEAFEDGDDELEHFDYCQQVPGAESDTSSQRGKCAACVQKGEPGDYVYTALGCIRTAQTGLTEDIVRIFMGVIGGVALLSFIAASFLFTTSQGDTNKVKQAKELMTGAVSGLFFIIFSIFVLQFLGVNVLGIPGLG